MPDIETVGLTWTGFKPPGFDVCTLELSYMYYMYMYMYYMTFEPQLPPCSLSYRQSTHIPALSLSIHYMYMHVHVHAVHAAI